MRLILKWRHQCVVVSRHLGYLQRGAGVLALAVRRYPQNIPPSNAGCQRSELDRVGNYGFEKFGKTVTYEALMDGVGCVWTVGWCPRPESNRYGGFPPRDFKSLVSTCFTTRASGCHLTESGASRGDERYGFLKVVATKWEALKQGN